MLRVGMRLALRIDNFHRDERKVLAGRAQRCPVGSQTDAGRLSGSPQHNLRDRPAALQGDRFQHSGSVGNRKVRLETLQASCGLLADEVVVEIEAHGFASGINFYFERLPLHAGPGPTRVNRRNAPPRGIYLLAIRRRLSNAEVKLLPAIPHDVPVMGERLAVAADIEVATVRAVTRVGSAVSLASGVFGIPVIPSSQTRLAEIVDGRPDEIADDIRKDRKSV